MEIKKTKKPQSSLFSRVSILDIVLSIRHFSIMLKSSLAIEDVLKVLTEQTTNTKLRNIYTKVLIDVQSGMPLADSMQKYKAFPNIVVSVIRAGEEGGTLEKNLSYLADYLKRDYELKKKVKGALFYPGIVLLLTVGEMLGVVFFILPKLESLFASFKNIPVFTLRIMAIARYIRTNNIQLALGILAVGILLYLFLKTDTGKYTKDRVALGFPIIKKLTKHSILATFSRSLGILLESGIPITNALSISSDTVGNRIYSKMLKAVHESVKSGQSLANSLNIYAKYFPPTFTKMVEVGEQTGALEDNLLYLHEFYVEDVQDMSNNLTTLLEPILLIFIGLGIGGLAISIIAPIYQLTNSINT